MHKDAQENPQSYTTHISKVGTWSTPVWFIKSSPFSAVAVSHPSHLGLCCFLSCNIGFYVLTHAEKVVTWCLICVILCFLFLSGWFCVSAAWNSQPFDLDNYTNANCLCPATSTGGRCQVGFYCPLGSSEPILCPPGAFCNKSGI